MKKYFLMILASMLLLTGCSSFTNNPKEEDTPKDTSVKITETFSHEDPKDLDFDKRVVLKVPEESPYFTDLKDQQNIDLKEMYKVFYGKENKTVAMYEYIVCKDEKNANDYKELAESSGEKCSVDGTLCTIEYSKDSIDGTIAGYVSFGMMPDDSMDSFTKLYIDSVGAVEVK